MKYAFLFAALTLGAAGLAHGETVTIDNFSFTPNSITVKAGAHVVFENKDDLPHTVVIPGTDQKSPMLDTDDHYEAVFDKPGTYKYFCGVHPMMTGEVTVANP